jgi:hypothetical protein
MSGRYIEGLVAKCCFICKKIVKRWFFECHKFVLGLYDLSLKIARKRGWK